MKRMALIVVISALGLGGCAGSGGDDGNVDAGEASADDGPLDDASTDLSITVDTPAFGFEEPIPEEYSLDGGNVSPALDWTVDAEGAVELVILVDDPDAPGDDPFVHWMVAGIDPGSAGVAEGGLPEGAVEGTNDMGEVGYGGPAPPPGETHAYRFQVVALDAPSGLTEGFSRGDLESVLDAGFLVSGETVGVYPG